MGPKEFLQDEFKCCDWHICSSNPNLLYGLSLATRKLLLYLVHNFREAILGLLAVIRAYCDQVHTSNSGYPERIRRVRSTKPIVAQHLNHPQVRVCTPYRPITSHCRSCLWTHPPKFDWSSLPQEQEYKFFQYTYYGCQLNSWLKLHQPNPRTEQIIQKIITVLGAKTFGTLKLIQNKPVSTP